MRRQNSEQQIEKKRKARALDLGFPNLDEIGYMDLRAKQIKGTAHDDCHKSGPDHKIATKAILEMSRKVSKLESTKKHQEREIKELKRQLASNEAKGACCCDALRTIHHEKEEELIKIGDAWKQKTYTLVNQYFKNLQVVRDENVQLKVQTYEAIDKLRQYQH